MTKMNSTSLYITTNEILLKSDPNNPNTWKDLYRLAPYLRNSLCCVVCGNLLIDPITPMSGKCQHHLCRKCEGGRKKIKPVCLCCKDCQSYVDNKTLRVLLQCYKKMCIMLMRSGIFKHLMKIATQGNVASGVECGAGNIILLIKEGAAFEDHYEINLGLSKSAYNILPCIYTNSATQTLQLNNTDKARAAYSDIGNKVMIKNKPKEPPSDARINKVQLTKKDACSKKPSNRCVLKSRKGCRCGNATATPGKLTCCGQRCPCYVESKPCIECKCRGCRNPHRPDGNKVRPHATEVDLIHSLSVLNNQYQQNQMQKQPLLPKANIEAGFTLDSFSKHLMVTNLKVFDSYTKISSSLPHAILVNDVDTSENDEEEILVDV